MIIGRDRSILAMAEDGVAGRSTQRRRGHSGRSCPCQRAQVRLTPGQGVTGLMVMGIGKSVSSEVRFSNFSLQTLPTYGLVVPPGQLALVLGAVLAV